MPPFAFEVNNFFPFHETFVSPWSQSFFFNREERLCSPSLQESTVIFCFREISFRLRFREPFSLVAKREDASKLPNCQATTAKNFHHTCCNLAQMHQQRGFFYCSTTSLAPVRRFFSSTPFQRFRSSTLTL